MFMIDIMTSMNHESILNITTFSVCDITKLIKTASFALKYVIVITY